MLQSAVFLLSLSSLGFEVLLARIFSIGQWHHLSYMVISIALLGFAASGTFLSLLAARRKDRVQRLADPPAVSLVLILYTVSAVTGVGFINLGPFDYFKLPLEPLQAFYLLTVFLWLALPFFFTGTVIALAYLVQPGRTGWIYFVNMTGSAAGALIAATTLPFIDEGRLIILAAMLPLACLGWPAARIKTDNQKSGAPGRRFRSMAIMRATAASLVCVVLILITVDGGRRVQVTPSDYKAMSQALMLPDTRVTGSSTGIRGRIDQVSGPHLRFAPGLSLKFSQSLPDQQALFKDGDGQFMLYDSRDEGFMEFPRFSHACAAHLLVPEPAKVLVIEHNGGIGIPCALAARRGKINVVTADPRIAASVGRHYGMDTVAESPRAFLARTAARFDLIQVENWGPSLPGTAALNQDYSFTREAFEQYFTHLTARGVVSVSRKLLLPPSDMLRLWAAAYESMRTLGVKDPSDRLLVLRNWDSFTFIAAPWRKILSEEVEEYARTYNFDLVYAKGVTPEAVNRFNVFDAPFHFLELKRLAEAYAVGEEARFFSAHPMDLNAQPDDRPFHSRFLKWGRLKALYRSTGSRMYTLFMSGEMIVAVSLLEAALISVVLLFTALRLLPAGTPKPTASQITYFLSVGAGFMFAELFFIQLYTLVFGDPVVSFSLVLTGVLIFSGFGGVWSQRLRRRPWGCVLLVLAALQGLMFLAAGSLAHKMLVLDPFYRYAAALVLILPLGVLMGLPFPLGMRYLLKRPVQRAYAWSANGCASVLTAVAAAQIALVLGISAVSACAALAYLCAFFALVSHKPALDN